VDVAALVIREVITVSAWRLKLAPDEISRYPLFLSVTVASVTN